jgi:predicted nucleotidyltransferase
MPTVAIQSPDVLSAARDFARRVALNWPFRSAVLFGSQARGSDDTADSDLDLLAKPTAQTALMDIGARLELKQLLSMDVDVLTPNSLPASFREQVRRKATAI